MFRQFWMVAALAACVGACTPQPPPPEMTWIRGDGQSVRDNPSLQTEFDLAKTSCLGEVQKANLSGTQLCRGALDCAIQSQQRTQAMDAVGKGCMAEKGYLLIPLSDAPTKMAELRAQSMKHTAVAGKKNTH